MDLLKIAYSVATGIPLSASGPICRIALRVFLAGKVDDLVKKYPKLENEIRKLSKTDPTPTKKYLAWSVKQLVGGKSVEEITDLINSFHRSQGKMDKKDLSQWGFDDLKEELDGLKGVKSKTEQRNEIKASGAEKLYEDEQCLVLLVKDKASACFYGKGTKWCITMSGSTHYEEYKDDNSSFVYVLRKDLDQDDPFYKVAVHLKRDEQNKVVGYEAWNAVDTKVPWSKAFPSLRNAGKLKALAKAAAEGQPANITFQLSRDQIQYEDLSEEQKTPEVLSWAVLNNKMLTEQEIRKVWKIRKSLNEHVTNYVISNQENTPIDILDEMWDSGDEDIRGRILKSPNSGKFVIGLLQSPLSEIEDSHLYWIARHPATPPEKLAEIVKGDYRSGILDGVANNPSASSETRAEAEAKMRVKDEEERAKYS